jgi:4-amino-4-deoxy-L-arabinose transferase-like glycosyltransferase
MTEAPASSPRFRTEEWLVIGATVILRLWAITLASRAGLPWIDPDGYLARAAALGSGHGSWLQALTDADGLIVPPLYSFTLSWAQRIGLTPSTILAGQAALAGLTCAAVLTMARMLASRRAALAAGWCFALSAPAIAAAPAFWSEALYVPLASCGLALLLLAVRARRASLFAATGLVLAAAALTRSLPIYVLPVLAAVIYVRAADARRSVLLMLSVFAVIVGAYVAADSMAAGRFMLVENSPEWHWRARASPDTAAAARFPSVPGAIARDMAASPVTFARGSVAHVRAVLSSGDWNPATSTQLSPGAFRVLHAMSLVLLAIVVVLPIRGVLVAGSRTEAWLLAAWVLVQIPLIALSATTTGPRYRAPLDPALLALAAAAIARV